MANRKLDLSEMTEDDLNNLSYAESEQLIKEHFQEILGKLEEGGELPLEMVETVEVDTHFLGQKLRERYNKCDSEKHKGPITKKGETNYCNYCFRHTSYIPEIPSHLFQPANTPPFKRRCNHPIVNHYRQRSISFQKMMDWLEGMSRIEKELIGSKHGILGDVLTPTIELSKYLKN